MLDMYNDAKAGKLKEVLEKHNTLLPLWNFIYDPRNDEHHVVKHAMTMLGMSVGYARGPYFNKPLSDEQKNELRRSNGIRQTHKMTKHFSTKLPKQQSRRTNITVAISGGDSPALFLQQPRIHDDSKSSWFRLRQSDANPAFVR